MNGKLLGIAIREKSRAEMIELPLVGVTFEGGLSGDFRGRRSRSSDGARQVTVLAAEAWQAVCQQHGESLPWTVRRANLLVQGLTLVQTTGCIIQVGDVQLEVTGETDPCERMNEASANLRATIEPDWRGGVCCRVIRGGTIQLGQAITMTKPQRA